jgi:hypothetical protein
MWLQVAHATAEHACRTQCTLSDVGFAVATVQGTTFDEL